MTKLKRKNYNDNIYNVEVGHLNKYNYLPAKCFPGGEYFTQN